MTDIFLGTTCFRDILRGRTILHWGHFRSILSLFVCHWAVPIRRSAVTLFPSIPSESRNAWPLLMRFRLSRNFPAGGSVVNRSADDILRKSNWPGRFSITAISRSPGIRIEVSWTSVTPIILQRSILDSSSFEFSNENIMKANRCPGGHYNCIVLCQVLVEFGELQMRALLAIAVVS